MRMVLAFGMVAACGARPVTDPPEPDYGPVVVTERGQGGGVLIFVAESAERLADLTRPPDDGVTEGVIDINPVWSPDGRYIAFASSRGRSKLSESSIWVVRARPGERPVRVTEGTSTDREPAWSPDSRAIVFASDRGGSFDLWRLDLAHGLLDDPAAVAPRQLTSEPTNERSPSWSPSGDGIAYMMIGDNGESSLWEIGPDGGAPHRLTTGPADYTPAWSPDGARIAYASTPPMRDDLDLYTVRRDGTHKHHVFSEPLADQTGPRWSADGRYLFCTSTLRAVASKNALWTSITFLDTASADSPLRALHDPAAPLHRMGVALAPRALDAGALAANPAYDGKELLRILEERGVIEKVPHTGTR